MAASFPVHKHVDSGSCLCQQTQEVLASPLNSGRRWRCGFVSSGEDVVNKEAKADTQLFWGGGGAF